MAKKDRLKSIEVFDPESGVWTELLVNIPLAVSGHSLLSFENKLILIGGNNRRKKYREIFELDPLEENGEWKERTTMKYLWTRFSAITFDKEIYVLGGYGSLSGFSDREIDEVQILNGKYWRNGPILRFRGSCQYLSTIIIPQRLAAQLSPLANKLHY